MPKSLIFFKKGYKKGLQGREEAPIPFGRFLQVFYPGDFWFSEIFKICSDFSEISNVLPDFSGIRT